MPLGAGKWHRSPCFAPAREATCATETAHGESSVRAIVQLRFHACYASDSAFRIIVCVKMRHMRAGFALAIIQYVQSRLHVVAKLADLLLHAFPSPWCSIPQPLREMVGLGLRLVENGAAPSPRLFGHVFLPGKELRLLVGLAYRCLPHANAPKRRWRWLASARFPDVVPTRASARRRVPAALAASS